MYTPFGDDFTFGSALSVPPSKRRKPCKVRTQDPATVVVSAQHRRQMAILRITEAARIENEQFRKP